MNEALDLNLNAAQCIHSATHWGSTTYLNICKGTTVSMPWGEVDYALAAVGVSVLVAVGLVLLSMAWSIMRTRY